MTCLISTAIAWIQKHSRPRAVPIILLAAMLGGCMDYVPTPEKLRNPDNPSSAFIVKERDIRGIYANLDVDSAIYAYKTTASDEATFWSLLEMQAGEDQWVLAEDLDSYRRYMRIIPRTGQQVLYSAEEVRVAFKPDSKEVVVAWIQEDLRTLPKGFPENHGFATSAIWPRFADEIGLAQTPW